MNPDYILGYEKTLVKPAYEQKCIGNIPGFIYAILIWFSTEPSKKSLRFNCFASNYRLSRLLLVVDYGCSGGWDAGSVAMFIDMI